MEPSLLTAYLGLYLLVLKSAFLKLYCAHKLPGDLAKVPIWIQQISDNVKAMSLWTML